MFDNGIANEFEEAHQKGLNRGFDLGWTYKGQFDRSIIREHLQEIEDQFKKSSNPKDKLRLSSQKDILRKVLDTIQNHPCNRERIFK